MCCRVESSRERPTRRVRGAVGGLCCLLGACLSAGCGASKDKEQSIWVASQTCTAGIVPVSMREDIPTVQLTPSTQFDYTGDGLLFRNFTLGPLGAFACEAPNVLATYASPPDFRRDLKVTPFDCLARDGRIYRLAGTGQSALDTVFIDMTFSAWFGAQQGTVDCTTKWRRVVVARADAGTLELVDGSVPAALPADESAAPDAGPPL
jgi:hypothetical protein